MDKLGNIIQKISTLKDNVVSKGATLFVKDDILYASNRGENSIAKFKINTNKMLTYIDSFLCYGEHSRHMILSKDKQYIVSCNQNSNNISFIDINKGILLLEINFYQPSGVANID